MDKGNSATKYFTDKGYRVLDGFEPVPGVADRWVSRDGRVVNQFGKVMKTSESGGHRYVYCVDVAGVGKSHRIDDLLAATFGGDSIMDREITATLQVSPCMDGFVEIAGCGGNYLINNIGQVLNKTTGRYVRVTLTERGYCLVGLGDGRKGYVHRLVAQTFAANPSSKPQINHINHLPWDNDVTNLEWVTPQENIDRRCSITVAAG